MIPIMTPRRTPSNPALGIMFDDDLPSLISFFLFLSTKRNIPVSSSLTRQFYFLSPDDHTVVIVTDSSILFLASFDRLSRERERERENTCKQLILSHVLQSASFSRNRNPSK